jgi:hypothetical protein
MEFGAQHFHTLERRMSSLIDEVADSDLIQSCCANHIKKTRGNLATDMAADIT